MLYSKFQSKVEKVFEDFFTQYALSKVDGESLVFENELIKLSFLCDYKNSFEITVCFVEKEASSEMMPVDLWVIMKYKGAPEKGFIQCSSVDTLTSLVQKLKHYILTYAEEFLQGHRDAFEGVRAFWDKYSHQSFLDSRLKQALNKADQTWKKGEYKAFVEVLGPLSRSLPLSCTKKLDYAKRALA